MESLNMTITTTKENPWKSQQPSMPMGDTKETEPEIAERIDKTFRVFNRMATFAAQGLTPGFGVRGAGGIGKTYEIEKALSQYKSPDDYHIHNGTMSAIGLYKQLYHKRARGQVLAIDDCDDIFFNSTALNLLKIATDPKKTTRLISWGKQSWALLASMNGGDEIPTEFEYYGSCIYCTNIDLHRVAEKPTTIGRHMSAFLTRMPLLDLGIHTKREVLVRIWYVMQKTNFLIENEIPVDMGNTIFAWLRDNLAKIKFPSIRTVLQLADAMKVDPDHWQELAEVTMFNK